MNQNTNSGYNLVKANHNLLLIEIIIFLIKDDVPEKNK